MRLLVALLLPAEALLLLVVHHLLLAVVLDLQEDPLLLAAALLHPHQVEDRLLLEVVSRHLREALRLQEPLVCLFHHKERLDLHNRRGQVCQELHPRL